MKITVQIKNFFNSLGKYKTFQTAENSFPKNARSCDDRREEFSCVYNLPILFFVSFCIWIFLFREFLFGDLIFSSDAISYYDHTKFYCDNILKGVFPLWNPTWFCGFPNAFFSCRIGVFNPFLSIIFLLRTAGVSHMSAYLSFLTVYYFAGMMGFYLLVKKVINDKGVAFVAYALLMFSSLGVRLFDSYMHLVCVPLIWFFYFLVAFSKEQKKHFFLGMTFTLMILATTYIPFYFLTIFLVFLLCYILFYFRYMILLIRKYVDFAKRHKIFVFLCTLVIILAMIPSIVFLKSIQEKQIVLPHRHHDWEHTPSPGPSQLAVDVENVIKWGIIEDLAFSATFADLRKFQPNLFYLPLFAYIIFFLGSITAINKRLLFLFAFGIVIFLIGSPFRIPVYDFLREHVFYFKYFRNLHFFLWFLLLPLGILFLSEQLKEFLSFKAQTKKAQFAMSFFILIVHSVFILYLRHKGIALLSSYFVVGLSCIFFILYFCVGRKKIGFFCLAVLLALIVIHPAEVYYYLSKNYEYGKEIKYFCPYDLPYMNFSYTRTEKVASVVRPGDFVGKGTPKNVPKIYIANKWIFFLLENINKTLFSEYYTKYRFIVYDSIEWVDNDNWDFQKMQEAFLKYKNVAFVLRPSVMPDEDIVVDKPLDERKIPQRELNDIFIVGGEKNFNLKVLKYKMNEIRFKTEFSVPRFLVYTDSYDEEWQAFIDGKEVDILRTNVAFKGIFLPAGEHIVYFRYGAWWRYFMNISLLVISYIVFIYLLWTSWIYWRKKLGDI